MSNLRRIVLPLVIAAALIVVIAGVVGQSFLGRVAVRDGQVQGCHRIDQDRRDDAQRDRDLARLAPRTQAAKDARRRIRASARRRHVNCARAFPHPSLLPWEG